MTSKEEFIYNFESFNASYFDDGKKRLFKDEVGSVLKEILQKVIIVKDDKEVEIRVDVLFDAATNEDTEGAVAFLARILTDLILIEDDDNGVYALLGAVFRFFLHGLGAFVNKNTKPERLLLAQYLNWLSDPKSGTESPIVCQVRLVNGMSTIFDQEGVTLDFSNLSIVPNGFKIPQKVQGKEYKFDILRATYDMTFQIPWNLSPHCIYFLIHTTTDSNNTETKRLFASILKTINKVYSL